MEEKSNLDKSKKDAEEHAVQKEAQRDRKIRTIGNYVHESVPVSNNEVSSALFLELCSSIAKKWWLGWQCCDQSVGPRKCDSRKAWLSFPPRSSYSPWRIWPRTWCQNCRTSWLLFDWLWPLFEPCSHKLWAGISLDKRIQAKPTSSIYAPGPDGKNRSTGAIWRRTIQGHREWRQVDWQVSYCYVRAAIVGIAWWRMASGQRSSHKVSNTRTSCKLPD